MNKYRIGQAIVTPQEPQFEDLLQKAYRTKTRPLCMCKGEPGIPMYIAQINERYWLKRMPNSGQSHAVGCGSWDMPEELSGRSALYGSGITYEGDFVKLRLDFALTHTGARENTNTAEKEKSSAKGEGKKLTLRGLLHLLWDDAGLTKWSPDQKARNWSEIRDLLLSAASDKLIRFGSLQEVLYIPESWTKEHKSDLDAAWRTKTNAITATDNKKTFKMMVLLAELKQFEEIDGGLRRSLFFHMPEVGFVVEAKLFERIQKNFGDALSFKGSENTRHNIAIATFSVSPSGVPSLEQVALMGVNKDWIPVDTTNESALIKKMEEENRSFIRPLRFNWTSDMIMPSFLMTDAGDEPVALYIRDARTKHTVEQIEESTAAERFEIFIWDVMLSPAISDLPKQIAPPATVASSPVVGVKPVIPSKAPVPATAQASRVTTPITAQKSTK